MAKAKAKTATSKWDVVDYLTDDGKIAAYLQAMIEESGNDPKLIAVALADIARAKAIHSVADMEQVAEDAEDLAALAEFRKTDDGTRIPHAVVKRMLADLTAQEDAAITAAARADPDAQPIDSVADMKRVRMTITRYVVVLHSDDGVRYGVSVPDLPGCFSAGDTREEALVWVLEAIELHREALTEDGVEFPRVRTFDELRADPEFAGEDLAVVEFNVSKRVQ